ncbi:MULTISPECIES: exosortase A [unclassified Alteromonas]|uniref:exosortase A n=1 Tax=unclassified Alteromonas TaxID=2614992 RepID=UPI00068ED2CF|nr:MULTISPECIES: exosortase A [unclassified Alteromonas]
MNNVDAKQDVHVGRQLDLSFKKNSRFYLAFCVLIALWIAFTWQGLTTVVSVWYGNEIFNHGFFIVPGALYLIYLKRDTLLSQPIHSTPLAFIVIVPAILLYIVGMAGDIQLFMHTATFTLLPALIWLMIGTQAAKTVLFPLCFMLFSVPVGEQLIPYLQEVAADGSVALLQVTGVPLFRSGLYIEIPQGRFLVAEACSGVSFFIASFVIGSLYAYLNLVSAKRKAVFVIISLIFPVLANIVRVYGIILIAYWTDMEHAAGADHLIYGWFFFAFVIVCLLGIGELMRESHSVCEKPGISEIRTSHSMKSSMPAITIIVALLIFSLLWVTIIEGASITKLETEQLRLAPFSDDSCKQSNWQPLVNVPDTQEQVFLANSECNAQVYRAWFSEGDNELVSNLHRLYDPEKFSLSSTTNVKLKMVTGKDVSFEVKRIVSVTGETFSVVRWYELDGNVFTSSIRTKIYQLKNVLLGKPSSGTMWIVTQNGHDVAEMESALTEVMSKIKK